MKLDPNSKEYKDASFLFHITKWMQSGEAIEFIIKFIRKRRSDMKKIACKVCHDLKRRCPHSTRSGKRMPANKNKPGKSSVPKTKRPSASINKKSLKKPTSSRSSAKSSTAR